MRAGASKGETGFCLKILLLQASMDYNQRCEVSLGVENHIVFTSEDRGTGLQKGNFAVCQI